MSKHAQKKPGTLVISLDFEMFWGMADVLEPLNSAPAMRRVHEVVPRLLKLFETYGVHATWATVGGMMAHDDAEFLRYLPKPAAPQTARMLDKLGIGQPDGAKKCPREILYAPELIHKVAATPGQEIGTHTYSHYYCSNADSTPEAFAAEIRAAMQIAEDNGYEIHAAVFPRNQLRETYLRAMDSVSPLIFRGEERGWIKSLSLKYPRLGRVVWYADHYLPLQHCSYDRTEIMQDGRYNVRDSRFYKPYRPQYRLGIGYCKGACRPNGLPGYRRSGGIISEICGVRQSVERCTIRTGIRIISQSIQRSIFASWSDFWRVIKSSGTDTVCRA